MNAGENALTHGLGPLCAAISDTDRIRHSPRFDTTTDDKAVSRQRLRGKSGTSFGRRFVPPATAVQIGMERNRGVNDPVWARRTWSPRASKGRSRHGSRCLCLRFVRGV